MSTFTINTPRNAGFAHWFEEARAWFRHARAALRTPHQPIDDLSERDLQDIALHQSDIGRLVDRDKNLLLQASLTRAHSRLPDQF